jgi:hypothetical protein
MELGVPAGERDRPQNRLCGMSPAQYEAVWPTRRGSRVTGARARGLWQSTTSRAGVIISCRGAPSGRPPVGMDRSRRERQRNDPRRKSRCWLAPEKPHLTRRLCGARPPRAPTRGAPTGFVPLPLSHVGIGRRVAEFVQGVRNSSSPRMRPRPCTLPRPLRSSRPFRTVAGSSPSDRPPPTAAVGRHRAHNDASRREKPP